MSMRRIFLALTLLLPVTVLVSSASLAQTKLDATILSFDGKDFVRTETTLMQDGQSACDDARHGLRYGGSMQQDPKT